MKQLVRGFIVLSAGLMAHRHWTQGYLSAEDYAECIILAAQVFPLLYFPYKAIRSICRKPGNLEQVLFYWPTGDPFTVADMCRSFLILGAIGSGKTSSSGKLIARTLLASGAGIIVFGSKPEDLADWMKLAKEAGRLHQFRVFSPESALKCNILTAYAKSGMDANGVVEELVDIAKTTLKSKEGGESAVFWEVSQSAMYNHTINPLMLAFGEVKAADIRRMIANAPRSDSCLHAKGDPSPEYVAYHKGFHFAVMYKATEAAKAIKDERLRKIALHDMNQAALYWNTKYANEDVKTRSNIEAGVLGFLDVFLRGIVHDKLATETTISAADLEDGAIWFVDFSPSKGGASSRFICTALKRHVQAHCLRRTFKPGVRLIALFSDECQRILDTRDAYFIDECRSHGSCLVYLSQNISNFTMTLGRENADSLLGQFGFTVFHASDPTTAKYASERIGSCMQETISGSLEDGDLFEQVKGRGWKFSFQTGVRPLVEPREFFLMKTGGHANRLKVDGFIVKTGTPFKSNGSNHIRCEFTQR